MSLNVDHIGMLPILNSKNGFNGNIYTTYKSSVISKPLLEDCFKIHKNMVRVLKQKGKKVDLLYNQYDLYDCFNHFKIVDLNKEIIVDSNLKLYFRTNSHTIDSTNVMISIKKPNTNRYSNIWYSSDLGNNIGYKLSNYLSEQDIPLKMDLAITEATYSKKPKKEITKSMAIEERKKLKDLIYTSLKEGKRILMPTFSFSRSQQLITYLYEWFKDDEWIKENNIQFVMDSNLMLKINDAYKKVLDGEEKELFNKIMNWKQLKKISTYDGTMAFLKDKSPSVVLSSSGFLENGKINVYMPMYTSNSNSIIILTGYCCQNNEGSMAWKLLNDNQKTITFNGNNKEERTTVIKRAKVYEFSSFSGHASYSQLLELYSKLNCPRIVLHHMEESNKEQFVKEVKEYLRNKNKTTQVLAVNKGCYEFKL